MRSWNPRATAVVAVAVTVGVLAIPPVLSATTAAHRETVTLNMMWTTTGAAAMDILIANFQRVYPDIKVNVTYASSTLVNQTVLTQFQAGNAPDLLYQQAGNSAQSSTWPLAKAGLLLDLSGSPWVKRIYPPAKPLVSYTGKVYAWSEAVGPYGVLYNIDLFKQLGLKIPTQFSQVLAMCQKISAAGKIPFAQGAGDPGFGGIMARALYGAFVYGPDPNWDEKRAKNQVTFASSPLWTRALQAVLDMRGAGCFSPGVQGTTRPQAYAVLGRGDAVMSILFSGEYQNVQLINPNAHYGMFPLPAVAPKQTIVIASPGFIIAANKATKYPAQARAFINFIAREQQDTLFAKQVGAIAPLDVKKGKLLPFMGDLLPYFKANRIDSTHEERWPNPVVFRESLSNGILGLFTGQTNIPGILSDMDKNWGAG